MEVDEPLPWIAAVVSHPSFVAREHLHGGPELTPSALRARLDQLARSDPSLFLERYGSLLNSADLSHFERVAASSSADAAYEIQWHLRSIRRSAAQRAQTTRNRRFRAMQQARTHDRSPAASDASR